NGNLDLFYNEGGKERKKVISFGTPGERDRCVGELSTRMDWTASEKQEALAMVWVRYMIGLLLIAGFTGLIAWLEETGQITRAPAALVLILDLAGVWGVFAVGGL